MTDLPPVDVPNLPGFVQPYKRPHNRKVGAFAFVAGQRMLLEPGVTHAKPKFVRAPKPPDFWRDGSLPQSTHHDHFSKVPVKDYDNIPAWDALDRYVLRVYGYFREEVQQSNLEAMRFRRCIIYYYLEDDTMHIVEPKIDNSGMSQGTLVRRHRFAKLDGGYITPEDLKVGEAIDIYGKNIFLTDMDNFTREYYLTSLNTDQAPALPQPEDNFGETRRMMAKNDPAMKKTEEKEYREVMLGGGSTNASMHQFMRYDRKVCRFYAVVDDLLTPQYERRPFVIFCFMADNSIEVREQYPLNCGRDSYPKFYKRAKLAKGDMDVRGPTMPKLPEDAYLRETDFYVGQTITLANQTFFIYDADEFTRRYFKEELGVDLAEKLDVRLPERQIPRPPTPPYTGYGSWDDSMSSVLNLIPKVPKKDFHKLFYNDGKVLRFTAKFHHPEPEEKDRKFVISYFLYDDCVCIHEPPQRNLGIVTGKFLEKGVHLNQKTGRLFEPFDLLPGNIVMVFNHQFEITGMDEYTRKYMVGQQATLDGSKDVEDPKRAGLPDLDLSAVVQKLRESMRQQFPLVRDIFRRFDKDHNGVITIEEFRDVLLKFGYQMPEDEALVVMKYFDGRQDGQITYNEFCDAVMEEDYTSEILKEKANKSLKELADPHYNAKAKLKLMDRAETEKTRRAVRELGDIFHQHVGIDMRFMKEMARVTYGKEVTSEQIHSSLLKMGHAMDLEDVERAVAYVLPSTASDMRKINYVELTQAIVASFHDLAGNR